MRERRSSASLVWLLAACVLAASPCEARAWDGQRRGFSAGLSLGPSFGYSRNPNWNLTDRQYGGGASFFMGWAPSDVLEIALFDHLAVSGSERSESGVAVQFALGLSVIRYFAPTSPSAFAGGGVAFLAFGTPAGSGLHGAGGGALMGTLGYEIGRHWGVQLSVLYGSGDDDWGRGDASGDTSSSRRSAFFSPSVDIYVRGY
jgi:hypothetical protein